MSTQRLMIIVSAAALFGSLTACSKPENASTTAGPGVTPGPATETRSPEGKRQPNQPQAATP